MPSVSFQSPAVLLCLIAVPPLWFAWRRACARARGIEEQFRGPDCTTASSANLRRGVARLLALALLIVGLAGPACVGASSGGLAGVPVVFVLDVSPSMAAPDGAPDRMALARAAVRDLCALLPNARIALVAGGGEAAVVCPPTEDRDAFLAILDQAGTDWMPAGTHLLPALAAARGVLAREGGAAAVVLVSDGEDHGPSPEAAIRDMRRAGAVVHTVTVGSADGVRLPLAVPAEADALPVTRARPEAMAAWARLGGGHAWSAPARLPALADSIVPRSVELAAARRDGRLRELGAWLYAAAALLLALSAVPAARAAA